MMTPRTLVAVALLAVAGCGARPVMDYGPVARLDAGTGYYPANHIDADDDALMILTMSGGGKRAAAFSQGMLDALATIRFGRGTLLDEVDMVSSVSGGSVTAANYAVNGPGSFGRYRETFLDVNFMPRLKRDILLDPPIPWSLIVENRRIEPVVKMFERTVAPKGFTFGDIPASRPYWILNATDIGALQTFAFTQYQFDTICSDVDGYPVARALAASAGYPVALSSVVIRNEAPCPAQYVRGRLAPELAYLGVFDGGEGLLPGTAAYQLERFRGALANLDTCATGDPGCQRPEYIHLFDGGIADNLGLSEPLWLLTDAIAPWNPMMEWAGNGKLRRVTLVTADAGTAPDHVIGTRAATPTMLATLRRVISAAIGRRTVGLTAQASVLPDAIIAADPDNPPATAVDILSFARIEEPACRHAFLNLPTDWGLAPNEVAATIAMGAAMTYASQALRDHAGIAAGSVAERGWDAARDCEMAAACACLAEPAACAVPACTD